MGAPSGTFLWDRHQARIYFWCWACAETLAAAQGDLTSWGRHAAQGLSVDDEAPDRGPVRERSEDLGV